MIVNWKRSSLLRRWINYSREKGNNIGPRLDVIKKQFDYKNCYKKNKKTSSLKFLNMCVVCKLVNGQLVNTPKPAGVFFTRFLL